MANPGRTLPRPATTDLPPAPRGATTPSGRVAIVSASVGAGHDGAAAELERRLLADGLAVDRHDLLDLLPAGLGRAVRDGYHRMLVMAPWAYQRIYAGAERAGGGGPAVRALLRAAEDRVLSALHPDVGAVVSTYPGASRVLGNLRLAGRLAAPVLTYLTDFSAHPLWVAQGVDVHLAAHAVPAAQARAAGARDVRASAGSAPAGAAKGRPALTTAVTAETTTARRRGVRPRAGLNNLGIRNVWLLGGRALAVDLSQQPAVDVDHEFVVHLFTYQLLKGQVMGPRRGPHGPKWRGTPARRAPRPAANGHWGGSGDVRRCALGMTSVRARSRTGVRPP